MRYLVTIKYQMRTGVSFPWTDHETTLDTLQPHNRTLGTLHDLCLNRLRRLHELAGYQTKIVEITLTPVKEERA